MYYSSQTSWKSQPLIKNTPASNLPSNEGIHFSENTHEKISQFALFLNLQFFSNPTIYHIKKDLFPVVDRAWQEEKQKVANEAIVDASVSLNGLAS